MDIFFNHEALERFMIELGFWGPVVFFLLQVVQAVIIPIPGNILTMVGGALFGIWPGFLLAYAGNVVGSVIGFFLARKAGRAVISKFLGVERFNKYMDIIGTESAGSRTKILLISVVVLPFLPSDFMCIAVGVTPISFRAFIIIVITCRPWGQLAAALLGASTLHLPFGVMIPLVAAIIIVCALAVCYAPRLERLAIRWAYKLADSLGKRKQTEKLQ